MRESLRHLSILLALCLLFSSCSNTNEGSPAESEATATTALSSSSKLPADASPSPEPTSTTSPVRSSTTSPVGDELPCVAAVPNWSPPTLSVKDFCTLTDLLANELASRFPEATLDLEAGTIVVDPLSPNPAVISVGNLMGVILDVEAKDWAESVSAQVDGFENITGDAFAPGSQEWLSSLRVLMYDAAYDNRSNTEPAWHELVTGLQVAIVLDTGTAVKIVRLSELVAAELSYDEAFDRALEQTQAIEFFTQDLDYVTVVSGETIDATFYSGSSILGQTDLFDHSGSLGTLVVIATRESTILIDLEQASGGDPTGVTETVVFAGSTSYQDFLTGPSSVTPNMLWWYAGELHLVEVSDTMIQMPDELLALLG